LKIFSEDKKEINLPYIKLVTFSDEDSDSLNKIELTSKVNSLDTQNAAGEFRQFDNLLIMQEEMEEFFKESFTK